MRHTELPASSAIYQFALVAFLTFALALLIAADPASAQTTTAMGNTLCQVVDIAQGNLGQGLAVLAVIVVGVGATMGKVSWGLAITVAVGIAIIFNAQNVLTAMGIGSSC